MKPRSLFLIDLSARSVYCASCRTVCRSLELEDCVLFWCSARHCTNTEEVRLYNDHIWKVFAVSETMLENSVSEVKPELILSIGS
jgi:hypothetical protein